MYWWAHVGTAIVVSPLTKCDLDVTWKKYVTAYHSPRGVFFLWCQRQPHRDVRYREVFCHTGSDRHSVRLYCCSCTPPSRVRLSRIPRQQSQLLSQQNDQSGGKGFFKMKLTNRFTTETDQPKGHSYNKPITEPQGTTQWNALIKNIDTKSLARSGRGGECSQMSDELMCPYPVVSPTNGLHYQRPNKRAVLGQNQTCCHSL